MSERIKSHTPSAYQLASIQRGELGLVVVKLKHHYPPDVTIGVIPGTDKWGVEFPSLRGCYEPIVCPFQPGDVVACKERHAIDDPCDGDPVTVHYESDGMCRLFTAREPHTPLDGNDIESDETLRTVYAGPWQSARSMPLWAARYSLLIKSVEVRRVNTITEAEAIACGIERRVNELGEVWFHAGNIRAGSARSAFQEHYTKQHGPVSFESDWCWFVKVRVEAISVPQSERAKEK